MNPTSDTMPPPSAKSAGGERNLGPDSPSNWRDALLALVAARISLIQLESKDAVRGAVRRAVCIAGLAVCAVFAWGLLVSAAVAAVAHFAAWPWYWVAMGAAGVHALAAALFARAAKSPGTPPFPVTRAEFQKDREWIEQLKKPGKSNA